VVLQELPETPGAFLHLEQQHQNSLLRVEVLEGQGLLQASTGIQVRQQEATTMSLRP
jgi:hypothetical protein